MSTNIVLVLATLVVLCSTLPIQHPIVPTPHGYMPTQCVHKVNSSDLRVAHQGKNLLITTSSSELYSKSCVVAKKGDKNGKVPNTPDTSAYAQFTKLTISMSYFSGRIVVPPNPVKVSQQTLFYYMEIIHSPIYINDYATSVGCVLTFTYDGTANSWSIYTSYQSAADFIASKATKVQVGDTIFCTGTQASDGTWTIEAKSDKVSSPLVYKPPYTTWVMAKVGLSAYSIVSCGCYPPSGNVTYSDLTFKENGNLVTPGWGSGTEYPVCNAHAKTTTSTVQILFDTK